MGAARTITTRRALNESFTMRIPHLKASTVLLAFGLATQSSWGAIVIFNNRVFGEVVSPVYGPELTDVTLSLQGNTPSGTPIGTVNYTGGLLTGSGYSAQLWAGPAGTPDHLLAPVPGALTVFRTDRPGFIEPTPSVVDIPGVGTGESAQLQLRVWANATASSWTDVLADPTVLRGQSLSFLSLPLGGPNLMGPDTLPPSMAGLTSFNVASAVPEPSSAVLAALILAGFVLGRSSWRGASGPDRSSPDR